MYCVIQKIENKKLNTCGEAKKVEVVIYDWGIGDDKPNIHYGYELTGKFERSIKTAYRISIHKSYRKDGIVKKKQWVLCTMGYYDITDNSTWIRDYMKSDEWERKLKEMKMAEDELCNMVYDKLDPIIAAITKEYESTEEYKTKAKNNKMLQKYFDKKTKFESKYGNNTYDYCYDVFGVLRNEEYLKKLQASYKAQRSYYDNFKSNYSSFNFGGYDISNNNTYTDKEKEYLKTIYKAAALKLHPDVKKDDGEGMKFLNKLKEEWGI